MKNWTYPYMNNYDTWKLASPDEPTQATCRDCPRRNSRGVDEYGNTECDYCARTEADNER